jgi:hypothetical protein
VRKHPPKDRGVIFGFFLFSVTTVWTIYYYKGEKYREKSCHNMAVGTRNLGVLLPKKKFVVFGLGC